MVMSMTTDQLINRVNIEQYALRIRVQIDDLNHEMGVSFILYYALDWALEYILTWTWGGLIMQSWRRLQCGKAHTLQHPHWGIRKT